MVLKRTVGVFVCFGMSPQVAPAVAWLELGLASGSSSEVFLDFMILLSVFLLLLRVLALNLPATQHSCKTSRLTWNFFASLV